LPDSHVAKLTVIAHAECRRDCVGREIPWRGREDEAFDQMWQSDLLGRHFSFSSYAYCFLSFDLILYEWITHPSHVTELEKSLIVAVPLEETLLDECERVASDKESTRVLDRITQIRWFNALRLQATRERWAVDGLQVPQIPDAPDVLKALGLHYPGRQ
jgi:hypothetical protein